MKKKYNKPRISFDNFELSSSIAAGCEFISNHAYGTCKIDLGNGMAVFTVLTCEGAYVPPNVNDFLCYDAPSDNKNVFSS